MNLYISDRIREKLKDDHKVEECEIIECFANRDGRVFEDTRANNQTDPATLWFVAETNRGRILKIVFIQYPDGKISIKTAYIPEDGSDRLYDRLNQR